MNNRIDRSCLFFNFFSSISWLSFDSTWIYWKLKKKNDGRNLFVLSLLDKEYKKHTLMENNSDLLSKSLSETSNFGFLTLQHSNNNFLVVSDNSNSSEFELNSVFAMFCFWYIFFCIRQNHYWWMIVFTFFLGTAQRCVVGKVCPLSCNILIFIYQE